MADLTRYDEPQPSPQGELLLGKLCLLPATMIFLSQPLILVITPSTWTTETIKIPTTANNKIVLDIILADQH